MTIEIIGRKNVVTSQMIKKIQLLKLCDTNKGCVDSGSLYTHYIQGNQGNSTIGLGFFNLTLCPFPCFIGTIQGKLAGGLH